MGNFKNNINEYQIIPRKLIFDTNLSDRARFVFCYMASKPNDWDFYMKPMANEIGYSEETLRKYINELVESGWLTRMCQKTKSNGTFGSVEYVLNENPVEYIKNTDTEIFRYGESPTQHNIDNNKLNNNINIKEKINKKENKTEKEVFDEFRKLYKGTKRGLDTEFDNFKKKHKDYKQVLPILKESYLKQEEIRDIKTSKGEFVPQYANLQTWINQRRWEIEDELFDVVGDKITNERFRAYLRATKEFPMTYIRQLSESEFNDLITRYPADLIYNKVVEIVNKPNGAKWLYEEIKTRIRNGQ